MASPMAERLKRGRGKADGSQFDHDDLNWKSYCLLTAIDAVLNLPNAKNDGLDLPESIWMTIRAFLLP